MIRPEIVMSDRALSERTRELQRVLLAYLQAASCPPWPGSDGLTIEDILRCYPQAIAAGAVPDRPELLRRHPHLVDELAVFFRER